MTPLLPLLLLLLSSIRHSSASSFHWLHVALSSSQIHPSVERNGILQDNSLWYRNCESQGLTETQQKICSNNPIAMEQITYGGRDAVIECQYQFKYERWNCTTAKTSNDTDYDVFGATIRDANKEASFISAITSAGLAFSITKGCSSGKLLACSCDTSPQPRIMSKKYQNDKVRTPSENWRWGGCSDNVDYGVQMAQQFTDKDISLKPSSPLKPVKKTEIAEKLMALHNNRAGREVVRSSMETKCRCHGVSGSCEFKTCWRSMKDFTYVGEEIKAYYDHSAVQVAKRAKRRLKRRERAERKRAIERHELVFLNNSPNYCDPDPERGILGTKGRECKRDSHGADSCKVLCCGRGYDIQVVERVERCHCKFVWCCHVKCKECTSTVELTTCK